MLTRFLLALSMLLAAGATPAAGLHVVATSPSMGALVREVGGPAVQVTVLAPPDRDMHTLQAKPSMIHALRDADLLVALGAELEVGWLPVAITSSTNAKLQPGQPGYFEAAAQVDLLDKGMPANRALGDVHPVGNPHLDLDPVRMAQVGRALAQRLGQLDPSGAADYRSRADGFAAQVDRRVAAWTQRLKGAPGVVLYHRDAVYLLGRFHVALLGTVEQIPGVPPTAAHIKDLTTTLAGKHGVVLYASYQSAAEPDAVARQLGWPAQGLPLEPPLDANGEGYLRHIDRWVEAIAAGKR
jgi:zinc/manganese transport system substrate-binding protein